jgi:hypothetical protein
MSEHITHTAICDDVRRICLNLDDLPQAFKDVWSTHADISRLGGVTRHADLWSADIIAHVRDHPEDADAKRKLAFVLGALTHRSIDRHMKPVFAYFKQAIDARTDKGTVVNECTIYCDMLILKEVFAIDHLFSDSLFDKSLAERRAAFQELMRTTWQRILIHMHTFKPDDANVHAWLSNLFKGVQDFGIRMHLYDEVAANPDPEKWHKYLTETNFYDAADPIIAAARSLQRGESPATGAASRAVEATGPEASLYARAMKRAVDYIRAAAQIYRNEINAEQAKPLMDIGVPELAMTYVPPGAKR